MEIPASGYFDLLATLALSLLLTLTAFTRGNRIIRTEGALLMFAYVSYMVLRTISLKAI